jgi:porphobilinogen synthase
MSSTTLHEAEPVTGSSPVRARPAVRRFLHREPLLPVDLCMPLLVRRGESASPVPTVTLDQVGTAVRELNALGVGAVKIFAEGDRTDRGGDAASADAPLIHAIKAAKDAAPDMAVMTETCLCSYTSSRGCVLTDEQGRYDHGATLDVLGAQAVHQAEAGADILGPAAMVDGLTGHVRAVLDEAGHRDIALMPHLIMTSRMYDGYRAAMNAAPKGNRAAFQVHPSRPEQAVAVARRMVDEGADMILLEPALHTIDLLARLGADAEVDVPLVPFCVSGEWSQLTHSGTRPIVDYLPDLIERLAMYKRSGAAAVITYNTHEAAQHLVRVPRPR